MDDEAIKRLAQAVNALVKVNQEFAETLGRIFKPIIEAIRKLTPILRGIEAKRRWREARQTARYLGRHPDLAALDGYFDRWYVGIP